MTALAAEVKQSIIAVRTHIVTTKPTIAQSVKKIFMITEVKKDQERPQSFKCNGLT
jgi:hypothetical protein